MKETDANFNLKDIQPVDMRLLSEQVDIILRSLELYAYNLEYMLNGENCTDNERQQKLAMLKYTYEQILSEQAEQVNINNNNPIYIDIIEAIGYKTNTPNILPIILEIDQSGVVLNKALKNLLSKINLGLKTNVINVIIPEIAKVIAIIYGSDVPNISVSLLERIATGIVISPL